jgi:hypothetical protein
MVFEGGLCAMSLKKVSRGARLSLTETARTTGSQRLSTTQDKTIQWDRISEALSERHTPQRLVQIHLYILMSNTLETS